MFDSVGESITVEGVRSFLNENKNNEIQFDIATLGGDLNTGLLIHDLIANHPKKTVANIIGLTASAGTVIALGCDEIQISDNALFLIHNGWTEVTGNVYDMQKAASDLMKTDAIMVKIYREKTGLADERIKNIMKASDWMSPQEALELGFVDRINSSGVKIAASAIITEAQRGKVNDLLLIKLKEKMNIFGKKGKDEKPSVLNVLALKDGKSVLINADVPSTGVEVAPLGAMSLEDGEYELADGRVIVVAGGVITEVKEKAMDATVDPNAEILAAVSKVVKDEVDAVRAEFTETLSKIQSTHKPAKGIGPINPNKASVNKDGAVNRVLEIANSIHQEIEKSRKA